MKSLFTGLCVLTLLSPSAFAQAPELLAANLSGAPAEAGFFDELPVVLTVSRLAQPTREAPASVTVIDSEMIRLSGARHLADLLRLVPGFQVAQSIYGAPFAVYHGLTTDESGRMQVLIDGRSQYSQMWFGGVNWNLLQVSLADIERIEVVRGSNSAAFGANAQLGVVNIVTRSPDQTIGVEAAANHGNNGTRDLYARIGWGSESASFRLSVEQTHSDGLDAFPDTLRQQRFSGRADLRLSAIDELRLTLGGVRALQGVGYYPETNIWIGDEPPHLRDWKSGYAQVEWARHLGAGDELKLRYFAVRETMRASVNAVYDVFRTPFPTPGSDMVGDVSVLAHYRPDVERHDLEAQHTVSFSDRLRAVYGAGARRDIVFEPAFFSNDSKIQVDLVRAFGNLEWRALDSWLVNFGMTVEKDNIAGTTWAPRLMNNWLVSPTQTLRAGVSRAYRTPSLIEQRSNHRIEAIWVRDELPYSTGDSLGFVQDFLSLRTLKPEELTAKEIGYLGEWKSAGLLLDLRAFVEDLKHRVVKYDLDPAIAGLTGTIPGEPIAAVFANGQEVRIRGIEGQLRWAPTSSTRFFFNHAIIDIKAYEAIEGLSGAELARVSQIVSAPGGKNDFAAQSAPNNQSSLHWIQSFPGGFESSLAWYRVNTYKWTQNTSIPGYHRLDWRLSRRFVHEGARGEVAFTMRADGNDHAEYRDSIGAPARYKHHWISPTGFLSLRLAYQ